MPASRPKFGHIKYYISKHTISIPPNIIRLIKPRKQRCARNLSRMREIRNAYEILVGK